MRLVTNTSTIANYKKRAKQKKEISNTGLKHCSRQTDFLLCFCGSSISISIFFIVNYLTVQSQAKQHEEEQHSPELRHRHIGKGLWVNNVNKSWTYTHTKRNICAYRCQCGIVLWGIHAWEFWWKQTFLNRNVYMLQCYNAMICCVEA